MQILPILFDFCSHATSSRSLLGSAPAAHAFSNVTHTFSGLRPSRSALHPLRYVTLRLAHVLPGLPLLGMPRKLGPSMNHPGAPPPPPLSAQHSAGAQERFALLTSFLHSPRHITSFLSVVIVLLNFSIFPLGSTTPPRTVTQASPRGNSYH